MNRWWWTGPPRRGSGFNQQLIDDTLYDAFGQRQVSTMYTELNQYHVVMEAAPEFWQNPDTLHDIYMRTNTGAEVPLSSFTHFAGLQRAARGKPSGPIPVRYHRV